MRKIILAVAAAAAIITACWLLLLAAFPYLFGESGQAAYIHAHRTETITEVLAAAALLWIAWYCIRRSLPARVWVSVAGALVAVGIALTVENYRKVPEGARLVGGSWYVTVDRQPDYFDTVTYALYYRHRGNYRAIDDRITEYRFVPPDCLTFRGLSVSGRPKYAMCGYRSPAGTYDTMTADATLLTFAHAQPPYQDGWESLVQQQDFERRFPSRKQP